MMDKTGFRNQYCLVLQALEDAFEERLKAVVLFGSRARGESRSESDHDFFVVIEDLPGDPLERNRLVRLSLLPVLHKLPGSVSFVAKTPQEVAQNLTPLLFDVCIEGVCLYGERYFEPYQKRALAALHQAKLRRERVGDEWVWRFPKLPVHTWEITWEGYREHA